MPRRPLEPAVTSSTASRVVSIIGISGIACIAAGVFFGTSVLLLTPFLLIRGFAIVADSAQFSACVAELAEPSYVGTALTLQTAIGSLLTTVTIQLVPLFANIVGWRWAFAPLALGPLLGIPSMQELRKLPVAGKLAGGRK